jgi:hypothetical protein
MQFALRTARDASGTDSVGASRQKIQPRGVPFEPEQAEEQQSSARLSLPVSQRPSIAAQHARQSTHERPRRLFLGKC